MKPFVEYINEQKATKQEANYQAHPNKGQVCENCTMWRAPNKCTAVSGNIEPDGWCKWYKRSHKKS